MIDSRGIGRRLLIRDFGRGKIDKLTISDLGPNWPRLHATAVYRLNAFLSDIPYKFKITSSYRTPQQNKKAGGAANSRHLTGDAFDVWIFDKDFFTRKRLQFYVTLARRVGFNGIGIYKEKPFLHVDVRKEKHGWGGIHEIRGGKKKLSFVSIPTALKQFSTTPAAKVGAGVVLIALILAFVLSKR